MPKIVCWQVDCLYNVDGRCRAQEVEYDPADGCLTMELRADLEDSEDEEYEEGGIHLLGDED